MRSDLGESRGQRLAYCDGELEIMSPGRKHERANWILDNLIFVLCEETNRDVEGCGSLTCDRDDLEKGMEPDSCYYLDSLSKLSSPDELDLKIDPPPDLMIEVDMSRNSLKKIPILLALGVPEWWRYNGDTLQVFILKENAYVPASRSTAFPQFDLVAELPRFIRRHDEIGQLAMMKEFRQWVREQIGAQ
jgi:Uma2 family endonuclease